MSFKRTKVVMLPTEKSSDIILRTRDNVIHQRKYYGTAWEDMGDVYQHLYFLSDDEIKVGDWCYDEYNKVIFQNNSSGTPGVSKKIIATTDRLETSDKVFHDTFKQYLPQPSEGFIQKFVDSHNSGKPITEVNVEYISNLEQIGSEDDEYFEKLKVDLKDNTITIKKVKDTWTRDEVVNLLQKFNNEKSGVFDCGKWVEENL